MRIALGLIHEDNVGDGHGQSGTGRARGSSRIPGEKGTVLAKILRLLIANRGEIAVRVAQTCRKLGITPIAIHSKGETEALHVRSCTEAVALAKSGTAAYLDIDAVISAAKASKADAIHPGYGFLAENAAFAAACEKEGIRFVGPSSRAISLMGDKGAAKDLAVKLKIPVVASVSENTGVTADFASKLSSMPLPILIKPLAGGGGKGMKVVRKKDQLVESIDRARREAKAAFGDERLLAEVMVERARHIEVQVVADSAGHVESLFERDCTIQRRHQKVIEESPSPTLSPELRKKLFEAATRLTSSAKYSNLGTVEFLVDPEERFYFMEMNTRLQVEHPVTEWVTGLDLVELQIRISEGGKLEKLLPLIRTSGHSIEVRVYSEDPEGGFLPATGRVLELHVPSGDGVRVDSGIEEGMRITPDFDPLLFKLSVHAKDRGKAVERMKQALVQTCLLGVQTNLNYLQWVLEEEEFLRGEHFTTWAEDTLTYYWEWENAISPLAPVSAASVLHKRRKSVEIEDQDEDSWIHNPWQELGRFRMGGSR